MRCPDCAADIPNDSQFCPSCGKAVPANLAPPPKPPDAEAEDNPFKNKEKADAPPADEAPAEKAPGKAAGHADKAFCEFCQGVFPPGELEKVEGQKLCPGCRKRKESRKPSGRQKAAAPPDPSRKPEGGGPPGEPGAAKSSAPSTRVAQVREPLSGGRMAAFAAGGLLIVVILGVGLYFFVFAQEPGAGKSPGPGTPPPVKKEEPARKPDPPKPEVKKADPVPPPKPRNYDSRWFIGVYEGQQASEDGSPATMVFESDGKEKALIPASREVADHFVKGKRYKFKFTPTDEFFNSGLLNVFDLESTIQDEK
jgi:hypothetical protein